MTEPALLTAFLPMPEQAFRRFLRGGAGELFAEAAADIVINGSEDWLVLRYLKKEAALYLAYVLRWADRSEDIMARPYFKALLDAPEFIEAGSCGRIIISPGAMNFLIDGVEAAFTVTPQGCSRDDAVPAAEMNRFDSLMNTHVFKVGIGERSYQEAVRDFRVFDPKLRKRVDELLESHRQRVALERIPTATPLRPVRLFDRYHCNGLFMIFKQPGEMRPLAGLDAATCRQREWGASDAGHVAVDGRVIATDPERFRIHRCGEGVTFYSDAHAVYGPDLKPLRGADPKTFKHVKGGFCRDNKRWYAWDGTILSDVGAQWRIDASLYFWKVVLLISDTSVYLGSTRLSLDAATAVLKRIDKTPGGPTWGILHIWFADKDGDLLICGSQDLSDLTIARTGDPEGDWQAFRQAGGNTVSPHNLARRALGAVTPKELESEDSQRAFIHAFEDWLNQYLEPWRTSDDHDPYDTYLWSGIANYFFCCWRLGERERIFELYRKIEADAWFHPSIFHHTACAFTAAGDLDATLGEVRRALMHGYRGVDKLLADPDIAPLFPLPRFQELKAHREAYKTVHRPLIARELLEHLVATNPFRRSLGLVDHISRTLYLPNDAHVAEMFPDNPAEEAAYRRALAAFVDLAGLPPREIGKAAYNFKDIYLASGDLSGLSPATHLYGALDLYEEGLFWVDMKADDSEPRSEFRNAVTALRRMNAALAADPALAASPAWQELVRHERTGAFIVMARTLDE
jgi:hypothetical protein